MPLPKGWSKAARNAVLNVIGIVRIAMLVGRAALIKNGDVKEARIHQLESDLAMTREELRINGARMKRIDPQRRPQYPPVERMAILQLRAMRGWNKAETARRFFVTDDTIRAWLRRADDDSLVQTRTPVNRFPDFVRYAVQQIKLFCPTLGKVKIADKLARASIHIGKTTVGRILKEKPVKELLRLITIPEVQEQFEQELGLIIHWYNAHRPHDTLGGRTPNEVYFSRPPANEQPRIEPRQRWPCGSPCAKPQVGIDGETGDPVIFEIDCHEGRRHLPAIRARRAA